MSGTKLDISYHLDEVLEDEQQEEIMEYFRSSESDDVRTAHDEFNGDYSDDEIRFMRLKFLSEVAN